MRYLVTGATGFIGGQLARELRSSGHEVVALVRSPEAAAATALAEVGVALAPGDITDAASLRPAMAGVDGVFHVAGWYKLGERDVRPARQINVEGTRTVLGVMAELGIPKGVYTSTLAVFSDTHGRIVDESYQYSGPWLSEYERTKWAAHFEVAEPMIESGLPLVVVLPGLTYGPGDTSQTHAALSAYVRGRLPAAPAGTAFCWAHVADTAHGHVLAMQRGRPGESFIIGGPVHTLVEAYQVAERLTGVSAPPLHPPGWLLRAGAAAIGPVERWLPLPAMYRSETLRSTAGVTYTGDNAKARRELGYMPRPLELGLRETLDWERAQVGRPGSAPTGRDA